MSNFNKYTNIDLYDAVHKNTDFDIYLQVNLNVFRPVRAIVHNQVYWSIFKELENEQIQ